MLATTIAVPVLFHDTDGDRIIITSGRPAYRGLAITSALDADGRPGDLFSLTHTVSGLALSSQAMCDYCVHVAVIEPGITAIDWTRDADALRADPTVKNLCDCILQIANRCGRPCTLAIGQPR